MHQLFSSYISWDKYHYTPILSMVVLLSKIAFVGLITITIGSAVDDQGVLDKNALWIFSSSG